MHRIPALLLCAVLLPLTAAAQTMPSPEEKPEPRAPATTRAAALKAIGRVNTVDAVEFVCDRLRDGEPAFADAARNAISRLTNPELVPVLRTQIELVPAVHRAVFQATIERLSRR